MPTVTSTWAWYDPSATYTQAQTNSSNFVAEVIAAPSITNSSYTTDAAWVDLNDDGLIQDSDRLGTGDRTVPLAGEGLQIGGQFLQVATLSTFRATLTTTDGQTFPNLSVTTFQLEDGTVVYRFPDPTLQSVLDLGYRLEDVQSLDITSFSSHFTNAAPAGFSREFPCFVAGTLIDTPTGPRAVETLQKGDLVNTLSNGSQPVMWIGSRTIIFTQDGALDHLRPVHISGAAFGMDASAATLTVSPHHRVLVKSDICEQFFGFRDVLVPAKSFVRAGAAEIDQMVHSVTYVHFMCPKHEIVMSNGIPSETLYLGQEARKMLGAEALAEVFAIFPELETPEDMTAAAKLARVNPGKNLIQAHMKEDCALFPD